jgi:glycosyltransferase involved in cell wall biosynthesis
VPKALDHNPLVSIVIACPRGSWMLDECLEAIRQQSYAEWECIVLPDGDEKGPDDPCVRFIPTGKVRPAEKRNIGIREAKGEIVAFIDDDAYPDVHWLEYAVKYFGEREIGAVGGPGVTPPGDTSLARIGGRVYDNPLVSGNYRYRYRAGGVRKDVEDYPSCNLLVRKSVLDAIGGYRTDFWPGEDTLLCKDILDNWKRIVYDPWVVVYHHRRPLFLPHLRQLGRYAFHRGYFCKRFPSNSLRLSYFVPSLFDLYLLLVAAAGAIAAAVPSCRPSAALSVAGLLPLALYLILVVLTTFSIRPHVWLLTALGVVASHIWYGVRFVQGLCAKKAPCEYIGKDHAHG